MHPDSLAYKKAFAHYLRYGISIEIQMKATAGKSQQYIWVTMGDGKVRSSHAANEGNIFSWDNPPSTGNPGEEYGCRCIAVSYYNSDDFINDPPLEPWYPELALLSLLPAGRVLSALRSFARTPQFKPALRQEYERAVRSLGQLEKDLRGGGKITRRNCARTESGKTTAGRNL